MINDLQDSPSSFGWHAWAVVEGTTGMVIGDVGFKGPPDGERTVEMGYSIVPQLHRNGYGKEAVSFLMEHALGSGEVKRIRAKVNEDNIPSKELLRSLGWERIVSNVDMGVREFVWGERMERCPWCTSNDLYISYHDEEWGVPVHDDRKHFEFLVLEAAQAGLSWLTVLKRREGYGRAFADFDPVAVSKFGPKEIENLMNDPSIIRNRKKIEAAVNNAGKFQEVQMEFGSFDKYLWSFVGGNQVVNGWKGLKEIPARTELSDRISKDLKKRGFKFVGSTIIYAHLQAVGIVNDHLISCFRYDQLKE